MGLRSTQAHSEMDLHKRLPRDTNSARNSSLVRSRWDRNCQSGRKQHNRRSQRQQHTDAYEADHRNDGLHRLPPWCRHFRADDLARLMKNNSQ